MGCERMRIVQGETLVFTSGVYSSYDLMDVAIAQQDFDLSAQVARYLIKHPEQRQEYCFCCASFLAMLVTEGLVRLQPYREVHLGDHSCLPTWKEE